MLLGVEVVPVSHDKEVFTLVMDVWLTGIRYLFVSLHVIEKQEHYAP